MVPCLQVRVDNLKQSVRLTVSRRHGNKDVRQAMRRARRLGWSLDPGKGHRFGTLHCGLGCRVVVASTPRNPTTHAKRIHEAIDKCLHLD